MSGYILCQTKKAEVPYYITNVSTNVYTIEELCYYLYHNVYLLDQTIFNEGLCNWLQEELGLAKLAVKLRPRISKFASEADILYPIFKEINYLTYEELKQLNVQLTKLEQETPLVREKKKGDTLMRNGMYVQAMHVYQELLGKTPGEENKAFLASIWHNMGCAYSYLFQMEEASECFRKAYETGRDKEELKCFLLAYRSIRTAEEYENACAELMAEEETMHAAEEAWKNFAQKPAPKVSIDQADEILERLTRDYHRSTGS